MYMYNSYMYTKHFSKVKGILKVKVILIITIVWKQISLIPCQDERFPHYLELHGDNKERVVYCKHFVGGPLLNFEGKHQVHVLATRIFASSNEGSPISYNSHKLNHLGHGGRGVLYAY